MKDYDLTPHRHRQYFSHPVARHIYAPATHVPRKINFLACCCGIIHFMWWISETSYQSNGTVFSTTWGLEFSTMWAMSNCRTLTGWLKLIAGYSHRGWGSMYASVLAEDDWNKLWIIVQSHKYVCCLSDVHGYSREPIFNITFADLFISLFFYMMLKNILLTRWQPAWKEKGQKHTICAVHLHNLLWILHFRCPCHSKWDGKQ